MTPSRADRARYYHPMLVEDHRIRVARLLRGERRVTDLDRIFSDLRVVRPGRESVREVGHFAAHRGERSSGIVLERAADMQISAKSWVRQQQGHLPTFPELRAVGKANLAIMPPERLKERLRMTRQAAGTAFRKAVDRLESGHPVKKRDRDIVNVLGFSMMWQFSFDDRLLANDLTTMLVAEGALAREDAAAFAEVATFMALHTLALMHGAALKMPDGQLAPLRLAVREETGTLRIKADVPVDATSKPVTISVPLFESSLSAEAHCDPAAITPPAAPTRPVEVEEGVRIVVLA